MPKNRAVLITGASTGIGKACALHLDRAGWRVFAGVRRPTDGDALRQVATERLAPVILDVTDRASIAGACDFISQHTQDGEFCGLVNNAGIALGGPIEFLPVDDCRKVIEINFLGAFAVSQAFIPLLRRSQGRIANMSSISGLFATPFLSPYSTSKFALEAFSDALRSELRPWKIWVALIEPGAVATPIWEKSLAATNVSIKDWPAEVYDLYGPVIETRMKQVGRNHGVPPEKVARAVEHALTARRPRRRYPVGWDAAGVSLLKYLPAFVKDWLISTQLPRYGGR